jgi:Mrp family chromosome partitioning ATPase
MRELALAVRALAHTAGEKRTTRVVLVTSAVAGEGKSSVALSLARSVANGGQRCLLIDADVRNPSLHTDLGVPATPGLVEVTVDGVPVDAVAGTPPKEQFGFLSAGRPIEDTLRPFMADTFGQLLTEMKGRFDVIVIDSAPVLLAPEGLVLAGCADLTLLIVKWHTTPREIARKAATMITRRGAGPCLAVLSQVNLRRMSRRTARRELDYYPAAYRQS